MSWKPSRTRAREFANKMSEIRDYCDYNYITYSASMDSFYFDFEGKEYRISNHSVEASHYNSLGKYHVGGRQDDVVYIHASKTRLIEVYENIIQGNKVDGRGYVI